MKLFFIPALLMVWGSISSSASTSPLADLPTGSYYYEQTELPSRLGIENAVPHSAVLLRKHGFTVIGVYLPSRVTQPCFRGFLDNNQILNATRLAPPYAPNSAMEVLPELLDLDRYHRVNRDLTERDRAALLTCIQVFWR